MALAVTRHNTATNTSNNFVKSTTWTASSGSLIAFAVQHQGVNASGVPTDTLGTTYVATASTPFVNAGGGGTNRQSIWYGQTPSGGSNQINVNFTGNSAYTTATVFEITGHDTGSPYIADASGTSNGGTASIASGTLTLTGNAIICGIYETDGGATPTSPSGTQNQCDGGGFVWDSTHLTSTSETCSATAVGANKVWGCLAASFKEAAGGGGSTWGMLLGQRTNRLVGV